MPAPFDSNYKPPKQCGDSGGGHMAAAVEKSTDIVWVSTSSDGITWSDPIPATDANGQPFSVDVGAKSISIYQESAANSTRFVITNASGFMICSDGYGAAGTWMDY